MALLLRALFAGLLHASERPCHASDIVHPVLNGSYIPRGQVVKVICSSAHVLLACYVLEHPAWLPYCRCLKCTGSLLAVYTLKKRMMCTRSAFQHLRGPHMP